MMIRPVTWRVKVTCLIRLVVSGKGRVLHSDGVTWWIHSGHPWGKKIVKHPGRSTVDHVVLWTSGQITLSYPAHCWTTFLTNQHSSTAASIIRVALFLGTGGRAKEVPSIRPQLHFSEESAPWRGPAPE